VTSKEAQWSGRVQEWKHSGQPLREFANGKPYKASTLRWWATRLRGMPRSTRSGDSEVRLIALRPAAPSGESRDATRVWVEMGSVRIGVQPGFDAKLLREVVEALKGIGR
jgi:hypothetical protein